MDKDIKELSVEALLRYIKSFVENSPGYDFSLQFYKGQWRCTVHGIATITEKYLKDALGWMAMNIKTKMNQKEVNYK